MKEDPSDLKIEKLLRGIKLKEPKPEEMTNYLAGVRSKIHFEQNQTHIHFVPIGIAVVSALALLGLIYFLVLNQPKAQAPTITKTSHRTNLHTSKQPLSLEDEMAVLEAFSEEYPTGTSDLFGDEGTMEDLTLMDDIEFSVTPSAQGA